jgi:hypothetical protein
MSGTKAQTILFWSALALSTALGFSIAMSVFALNADLKEWLSFIGAIIGAFLAILGLVIATYIQIERQEHSAREVRDQEIQGARAILTRDLSAILESLERGSRLAASFGASSRHVSTLQFQDLNFDILLRLQRLVTLLPPQQSGYIAQLISDVQVYEARMRSAVDEAAGRSLGRARSVNALEGPLISMMLICIRVHRLFPWARREVEEMLAGQIEQEEVRSAERTLGLQTGFGVQLFELVSPMIARRTIA